MKKNISEERLRKQALKKFCRKLTKKFGYGSTSILEHFSSIKDPRVAQGKRHELITILVIAICATICGADGWVEIVEFGKGKEKWLTSFLNMPHGIPEEDTFRRVFNAIDPEDFQRKFISWINMNSRLSKGNVIAIDGKTMKGSRDNYKNKKPLHIVSAWASDHRLSLGQVAVDEKSNEITAIPELLKGLCIEGCIITIDAMGCQTKIAETIVEKKGNYIFSLKGNQGTLNDDIRFYFESLNKKELEELSYYKTLEKDHGRIEIRKCWICKNIRWLEQKEKWPKLKGIVKVESERIINGKVSKETRYYITSLDEKAETILKSIRSHWGIENGLHWVLDVVFGEDLNQILASNGGRNLGIVRHIVINLLNQERTLKRGIKTKRLRAACDEKYLEKILVGEGLAA